MRHLFLFICLVINISLAAETKILAFAGSMRADSYNKKLVQEAAKIARQMDARVTVIDLKDYPMPFYDADLEREKGMPSYAKELRDLMISSDCIMISSPQYNASIPAVLKNALDWLSRDEAGNESHEAFKGKKIAIMSASPGKKGGAKGLIHLRTIIEDCGGEILQQQVSLGSADKAFNEKGELINASVKKDLIQEVQALLKF